MVSTTLPRKRLGDLVKKARTSAGIKQAEAAQRAGVSQSSLSKIEDGKQLPAVEALRVLAELYCMSADDLDEALALREECAAQRRRPGVRLMPNTPTHFRQVAEFESEATFISGRFNVIIPGLAQAESYAKTLYELGGRGNIDGMLAERRMRQANVLDGPRPPTCMFVLHEACLHNTLGRPVVLAEQLQHLLDLGERGVTIAILPRTAAVSPTSYDLWLYRFPEGGRRPCAVAEHETGTVVVDSAAELQEYEKRLHLAMLGALDPVDSRQLIQEVLDSLR